MSSSDAHARVRCRFENGTYHLIVAQMANECGLDKWGSNSAVVRAESSSPTGPFRYKQTVLRPFAHNPTIRRLPSVHLGCPAAATTQCTRMCHATPPRVTLPFPSLPFPDNSGFVIYVLGGTRSTPADCRKNATAAEHPHAERAGGLVGGSMHVVYSASVYGPWSVPLPIEFTDGGDNNSAWTGGGVNP